MKDKVGNGEKDLSMNMEDAMDAHVRSEIEGLVLDTELADRLHTWDGKAATREQRVQFLTDVIRARSRMKRSGQPGGRN